MHYSKLCPLPLSSSKFVYYRVKGETPPPPWQALSHSREKTLWNVSRLYFSLHASARLPLSGCSWHLYLEHPRKSVNKIEIRLKQDKNIDHFKWTPRSVLLLPATLCGHKSTIFEWNGIRLLEEPRRYKHHANAQQCYDICILPLLLQFAFGFSWSRIVPCLYAATLKYPLPFFMPSC